MIGMIENKVESVKIVGRRDMNTHWNITRLLLVTEPSVGHSFWAKPFFNDAQEAFIFNIFIAYKVKVYLRTFNSIS